MLPLLIGHGHFILGRNVPKAASPSSRLRPQVLQPTESNGIIPSDIFGHESGQVMDTSVRTFGRSHQDSLLLLKDNLASYFREEIISGRLHPGEKIVEVSWAKILGISQTSIREALNILSAEGYVRKARAVPRR